MIARYSNFHAQFTHSAILYITRMVIVLLITSFNTNVFGQSHLNVSCGYSIPAFINTGVSFVHKRVDAQFNIGGFAMDEVSTYAGSIGFYFGKHRKYDDVAPWNVRLGYFNKSIEGLKAYGIFCHIGHEFHLTHNFGLMVGLGGLYDIYADERFWMGGPGGFPSGDLSMFYRISI